MAFCCSFALVACSHLLFGLHFCLLAFVACWHCCLLAFKLIILVTLVEIKRNRQYPALFARCSSAMAQWMGLPSGRGYAPSTYNYLPCVHRTLSISRVTTPYFLSSSIHLVEASLLSPASSLFWHVFQPSYLLLWHPF